MAKKVGPVSPFAAGGGGVRFELLVAVHYLVRLLRQEVSRGMPTGFVEQVRLQQRILGNPIDDIIVDCRAEDGPKRLFIQAKHRIVFSGNNEFAEVIAQAQKQLSNRSFKLGHDIIGLAIGEASNNGTVKRHVTDILNWAKTSSSARSFHRKVSTFSQKKRVLEAFQQALKKALGRKPTQNNSWTFLKHFVVIPFDFDTRAGRDTIECRNLLIDSVQPRGTRNACGLFTILQDMASEYAPQAGEITRKALSERISANAAFAVPVLERAGGAIGEILSQRLHNRIAAEKNSKKYIPQVFVEVGDTKDRLRLFCDPVLFLRRVVDRISDLDLFVLNRFLGKAGLKPIECQRTTKSFVGTFESVNHDVRYLLRVLNRLKVTLSQLERKGQGTVAKRVPKRKRHVYNEVCWRTGDIAHALGEWEVEPLTKELRVAHARVFAVVSRAGQGKTNLVCDLAVNCLAKRGIPCAFFTGKELGMVARDRLPSYIARAVYGDDASGTLDSLLTDIDAEASRKGTAGIILIDAINEHPELRSFSQELETFVEKCLEYSHVRVILTCRSEYFSARFGNLEQSSFANRLVVEKEVHEQMGPEHRKRLLWGYFRFFKIRPTSMSEHVHTQLSKDPFLLRVFCEAYGDPTAKSMICVGRLRHIRREALFREYFNRKLQALQSRATIKTGFVVGAHHPYQQTLRSMVEWMVRERNFSDVPLDIFPHDRFEHLTQLLDEDVLVRRDIVGESVLGRAQVLNFTFDACRDFLLADYMLNVIFPSDTAAFENLVHDLTDEQSTVAEGLQEYLFYASRHLQDPTATAIIKNQPWYEGVFADCVFDLDGNDITEEDANRLRDTCLSGDHRAPHIACNLLINYSTSQAPHANIRVLFDVFDAMSDTNFEDLCRRAFGASRWALSSGLWPVDKLVKDISSLVLADDKKWRVQFTDLVRLLLYLWDTPGVDQSCPARSLFYQFSERHPRVAKRLKDEHVAKGCKGYLEDMPLWARIRAFRGKVEHGAN